MPIKDYNKKKPLEVTSQNDSGTTQDKAQPIIVEGEGTYRTSSISFVDSKDLSGQSLSVTGAAFNNTGSKLYVTEANGTVFEYNLSTNFDVSTATFNQSLDVSGFAETPEDIIWNDDGTSFYLPDSNDGEVFQYDLSTAFDISTAGPSIPLDVSSETGRPTGISFSDAGSLLFVSAGDENVYKYSLSTSYDLSTGSFTQSSDFSSELSDLVDITVESNGKDLHLLGSVDNSIFEYEFGTVDDLSTTVFQSSESVSEDSDPQGLLFNDDGLKVYMVGTGSDKIYEYDTGSLDSTTGTGDVVIDFTNISGAQDIAVYDENGNLLDYEIESLDTAAETGVIWAYNSWVRDDTVQAQVTYGDNSANTDRQNVTGTWNKDGAKMVQHGNNNSLDSTSNNNDAGTKAGFVFIDSDLNGAFSFDGVDDELIGNFSTALDTEKYTVVEYWRSPVTSQTNDNGSLAVISEIGPLGGTNMGTYFTGFLADGTYFWQVQFSDGSNDSVKPVQNYSANTYYHQVHGYSSSNGTGEIFVDNVSQGTFSSTKSMNSRTDWFIATGRDDLGNTSHAEIDVSEYRVYENTLFLDSDWIQADFDASPKAGQVYFSQQAAETISTVTDQTVTVPETQTTSTNPDPQINSTVDVSVPTSTATTVNPAPAVSPGAAPLNLTASTASTANPDFIVQPGNTTVQTPVSTATVSNPDPAVNAFNEITVPETNAATVNPAPTLTVGQTILTPETTVTSSNPDLTVQPGETSLNVSTTQVSATNPVIGLNRQIVVGVANNLESENPQPNLQAGAVSVQVPETTTLTENPALQVQPGETSLQTEQATNLQTVNPDFNTVSGAAELQLSETQLTASVQEPSIGLTLQFVSPTNALITNDERFFDMPDHTFTEGDLGDTLTATLKDDTSPEGVNLTGATEIRLVVKDRDGVKVFDKEMSLVDSANGKVEYKWSQGDFIEKPGVYRSKIKVFDSSDEPESFPNDGFRTIEVEEEIG
jgi:hypothetical protein